MLDAFTAAAVDACDELDGVSDGVISDPSKCHFNASSIVGHTINCTEPSGSIVLTDAHAQLVNSIWEGPRTVSGAFEWYGMAQGAPLTPLLSTSCQAVDNCTITPFSISTDYIIAWLARDTALDLDSITREDFDRLFRISVDRYTSIIGTDNPDLTDFKESGGKMIAWHGLNDQLIAPSGTVDYYQRASDFDQDVAEYYRSFLAPGIEHCAGGPGLDPSTTIFDSLIAWVERGEAPDTVPAIGPAVGKNGTRTIDLCALPKILTYIGPDPNQASSFTCQ